MRPGISNEMLAQAGVRQMAATEAQALCGVAEPGLWLPYRKLDGTAVRDGDKDYGRLRIEKPSPTWRTGGWKPLFSADVRAQILPLQGAVFQKGL